MGNRRKAREVSLQLLYEIDLSGRDYQEVLLKFLKEPSQLFHDLPDVGGALDETQQFTRQIIEGTLHHLKEIDQLIEGHSTHWRISRMASVDRNILRMAVFELLYCQDIPASVTINEAIEIAKKFGTEESSSFVNGILDHVAKDLKKM